MNKILLDVYRGRLTKEFKTNFKTADTSNATVLLGYFKETKARITKLVFGLKEGDTYYSHVSKYSGELYNIIHDDINDVETTMKEIIADIDAPPKEAVDANYDLNEYQRDFLDDQIDTVYNNFEHLLEIKGIKSYTHPDQAVIDKYIEMFSNAYQTEFKSLKKIRHTFVAGQIKDEDGNDIYISLVFTCGELESVIIDKNVAVKYLINNERNYREPTYDIIEELIDAVNHWIYIHPGDKPTEKEMAGINTLFKYKG